MKITANVNNVNNILCVQKKNTHLHIFLEICTKMTANVDEEW